MMRRTRKEPMESKRLQPASRAACRRRALRETCFFFPAEKLLFTVPDLKLFLAKHVESAPIADLEAAAAEAKQMAGAILAFNCLEKVSKARKSENMQLVKDAKKSISAKKCIPAEAVFALLKDNP
ncbi:unnamed protein product [Prorocentrum cordatum]|uniref:Uncharacterized protein n=1 Tax=Prorocentrum cordatum TaxID=2364126 RepID=A0ABN9XD91_9DINO|nr:unnamed protein product [Polarella glacialis]